MAAPLVAGLVPPSRRSCCSRPAATSRRPRARHLNRGGRLRPLGCGGCHALAGSAHGEIGPDLDARLRRRPLRRGSSTRLERGVRRADPPRCAPPRSFRPAGVFPTAVRSPLAPARRPRADARPRRAGGRRLPRDQRRDRLRGARERVRRDPARPARGRQRAPAGRPGQAGRPGVLAARAPDRLRQPQRDLDDVRGRHERAPGHRRARAEPRPDLVAGRRRARVRPRLQGRPRPLRRRRRRQPRPAADHGLRRRRGARLGPHRRDRVRARRRHLRQAVRAPRAGPDRRRRRRPRPHVVARRAPDRVHAPGPGGAEAAQGQEAAPVRAAGARAVGDARRRRPEAAAEEAARGRLRPRLVARRSLDRVRDGPHRPARALHAADERPPAAPGRLARLRPARARLAGPRRATR